jgi:hypothetical protein
MRADTRVPCSRGMLPSVEARHVRAIPDLRGDCMLTRDEAEPQLQQPTLQQ